MSIQQGQDILLDLGVRIQIIEAEVTYRVYIVPY